MKNIIEVLHLSKRYGEIQAVKNISFSVKKGSLFAFLGTNGAGKSTTIDILSTLVQKDEGKVAIHGYLLGKDDQQIRQYIGVVFQNGVLDDLLTIEENLKIRGSFYGMETEQLNQRIKEVAKLTGCLEFLKRPYSKLSGGQKRRADIARALLHRPKLLFLDEPTTGLDPKTRIEIWNTIHQMQQQTEMTVFLTTHYMEEASDADKIVILHRGSVIAQGTPSGLKNKYTRDMLKIYEPSPRLVKYLQYYHIPCRLQQSALLIPIKSPSSTIELLTKIRGEIKAFEVIHGTLDDVFLQLTEKNGERGSP
ncbi:ABC transporter [Clostridia bacterium]|nr:ABC transporter [Clostridia bacterium]